MARQEYDYLKALRPYNLASPPSKVRAALRTRLDSPEVIAASWSSPSTGKPWEHANGRPPADTTAARHREPVR